MAGRLLKEELRIQQVAGQGSVRTAAQAMVPLNGEHNVRTVQVRARPLLQLTEAQTDGIAVQGSVEFDVLYLTQEGQLQGRSTQAGFTAVIPAAGAAPKDIPIVRATVEAAGGMAQGSRLELSAQLALTGMALHGETMPTATSLEAEQETELLQTMLQPMYIAAQAEETRTFAEDFPVEAEEMERVVWWNTRAAVERVLPMDGGAEVSGSVELRCLLAGESGEAEQRVTIPFEAELPDDRIRSGMEIRAAARVRQTDLHLAETEDGQRALRAEYALEITADALQKGEMQVLSDAYPLSEEPFTAATAQRNYLETWEDAEQVQTVETVLELPADVPNVAQLVGAFAAPVALEAVGGEEAQAEGLLRITLLYRAEGQEGLQVYEQEVPFGVSFDGISGLSQVYRMEVGEVQAQKITGTQVQVRAEVEMEAVHAAETAAQVLEEVAFEGEAAAPPHGIVLYYPEENETLWDVAKHYRVSLQTLQKHNPAGKDGKTPLLVYRRLTAF